MTENQNSIVSLQEVTENNNKRHEFIKGEKILLIIAFVTAVLCDRLFFNIAMNRDEAGNVYFFMAIFEICFMIFYCAFNYQKFYKKSLLWIIAVLILSLCVWNFIFDYVSSYGTLTFLVIPCCLMTFCQIVSDNPDLKNISGIIKSWFSGWFIKPFSAVNKCVEVIAEMLFPKKSANSAVIKKVMAALLITVPLTAILVALLSGADKVFGYYVNKIFISFNMYDFIWHFLLIGAGFLFFYSFFWNSRFGKRKSKNTDMASNIIKKEYKADNLVLYIILSAVLVLYILFCTIQFAYLFASAGLPDGISYSEYARSGFAQIVMVSAINLCIFGCVLKYGKTEDNVLKVMLYILIAVSGIMLLSGFTRLGLYINTFGMTFLRLISAWFIIYLALVLILCTVRMIYEHVRNEKLPLIACCAVLLLFGYNVLGYINPDAFIINYNLSENTGHVDVNKWTEDNQYYAFYALSDDAVNTLINKGLDKNKYSEFLAERYNNSTNKRSFASVKLKSDLSEYSGKTE